MLSTQPSSSASPAAGVQNPSYQLADGHGYSVSGDSVHLHAHLRASGAAASSTGWALQLRTGASTPGYAPEGHLIAELPLPAAAELAASGGIVEAIVPATLPAGQHDHSISLVLAAGLDSGTPVAADSWTYPATERFALPSLSGTVGYTFASAGDRVVIEIGSIVNPRATDNVSGTLSLELWALPAAYAGGVFSGVPLAGIILGALPGQASWTAQQFDLPLASPAAGSWTVVLMLREWTGSGYTTRDYANFAAPVTFPLASPSVPTPAAAIAADKAAPQRPTVTPAAAEVATPAVTTVAPATKSVAPAAASKAAATPASKARAAKPDPRVPVNSASLVDFHGIKGLPKATALAIIAARPFKSLDDLLAVKGMGSKLLAKIRASLRLD